MRARPMLLMLMTALGACSIADAAAGPTGTRRFPLSGFHAVDFKGSDDVVVRVGPAFSVIASGPQAALDRLDIGVRDGTLRVSSKWNWSKTAPARIIVTLPALDAAALSGSGNMTVDPFRTPRFAGTLAGSGNLTLRGIDARQTDLSVAGSGNLRIGGRSAAAKLSVAGSGNIDAGALAVETLSASTAGSGDIAARATGTASASIVGSGNIVVHGTAHCTISKVGSGDVTCGRS